MKPIATQRRTGSNDIESHLFINPPLTSWLICLILLILKEFIRASHRGSGQFFLIHQEVTMLEVTSSAVENLKTYLAQNNIDSAVRIALMQGG
jgi:hypothetical protein